MILVPEIETVFILVPRTGSRSLKHALFARFPKAIALYRHMEADGVPAGYDRWQKVGVVRHPVDRLWSLYRYIKHQLDPKFASNADAYLRRLRESAERPFDEWIVSNETAFTNPYDSAGRLAIYPEYTVRHNQAENWKSQYLYLRPDLGTGIVRFGDMVEIFGRQYGLQMQRSNATDDTPTPKVSQAAADHVCTVNSWEIATFGYHIATEPRP